MYKIYLDSSDRNNKVVKLIDVTDGVEKEILKKDGNLDIVKTINDLLKENDLKPQDISEFIPALGPGSFTGLKIGVTIANVFNWALKRKKLDDLYYPDYGAEPQITPPKKNV
jgi:tRNA A37 threonylcarbamoyladenosine modification protein TsaB